MNETTRLAPLGKTHLRVTAWAVPGREPGQIRNLRHLIWSGPGNYVHLCYGGIADGSAGYPGEDMGRVCRPLPHIRAGPGRRRCLRIRAADIGGRPPD